MLLNSLSIFCGFFLIGVATFRLCFEGNSLFVSFRACNSPFHSLVAFQDSFCRRRFEISRALAGEVLRLLIALLRGCTPPPELFLLISFSGHRSWAVQGFWSGFLLVVFGCQDSPLEWLAGAYPHRFWLLSPLSALPDPPDAVSSLRFSIWDQDCWFLLFARPPELALPPWLSPLSAPFLGFPLLLLPLSVVYGVSDYSFSWQVRRWAAVIVARDMEACVRPQPRLAAPIFSPKSAERISLFDQGSKVFSDRSWTTSAVCWAKIPKYGPDLCLSIYFNGLLPAPI
ncbi:hypothetical protein V6N11_025442 [Hibiscus sabdariffa]|uniref:Uncharacterized protein n=1 Tax=Hibiscus sabdariffa TaxID=183260 RepID=A0ABR2NA25_9ROSI